MPYLAGSAPVVCKLNVKPEEQDTTGFRRIIDARIAPTLRHHGVTHSVTANAKQLEGFGFEKLSNLLLS